MTRTMSFGELPNGKMYLIMPRGVSIEERKEALKFLDQLNAEKSTASKDPRFTLGDFKPAADSKEKDEFEKLIKTITEDAYDWCNGSFDKKPDDYIFRLSITEAKPKLKAQILKDNPLAGLSDEQVELVKCSMESHSHWRTSKDMFDVRNLCIMILKKRKED